MWTGKAGAISPTGENFIRNLRSLWGTICCHFVYESNIFPKYQWMFLWSHWRGSIKVRYRLFSWRHNCHNRKEWILTPAKQCLCSHHQELNDSCVCLEQSADKLGSDNGKKIWENLSMRLWHFKSRMTGNKYAWRKTQTSTDGL